MPNKKPPNTQTIFSVDVPEDSSGYLLWRTTQAWQKEIKATLAPFDISHTQFVILAVTLWLTLTKKSPTQIEISLQAGLDKMTVSNVIRGFIQKDLMTRHEHPDDTRAKVVSLTPKGRTLITKLVPLIEATDARFFGKIPQEKQRDFNSNLASLITATP